MPTPLSGIRVLDLSRILAGPFCTMLLADLGAEVIKVERPGTGDDTRSWGPPFARGESAYFLSVNRNKQSLTLDLKTPGGVSVARELCARADVVVENMAPGTLVRLGLGLDDLRAAHPRLVTCSITGFGPGEPERPGYDALIQANGGLMSLTGEAGGAPIKVGVAICDLLAGQYALAGILAALLHRERAVPGESGAGGQHVEVALEDALVASLVNQAQGYLLTGEVPGRLGNAHPHIVPYQTFATSDGHVVIAVGNDAQFAALCTLIGRPELAQDERYSTNADRVRHRAALLALLEPLIAASTSAHWIEACKAHRVPAGPIRTLDEVFADPRVAAAGLRVPLDHPTLGRIEVPGNPIHLSKTPAQMALPPPLLGEHTELVLASELGMTAGEIEALRVAGAFGAP